MQGWCKEGARRVQGGCKEGAKRVHPQPRRVLAYPAAPQESFPDVSTSCANFKFSGRGQRETPVAGARTIVEILMVLPGRAAAQVRPGLSLTGFLIFVSKSLELEGILTSPMCVSKSWGLGEFLVWCV